MSFVYQNFTHKFLILVLLILLAIAPLKVSFAQANLIDDTDFLQENSEQSEFIDTQGTRRISNNDAQCVVLVPGLGA